MSTVDSTKTVDRYIVVDTNVYDRGGDRIARFQNTGVAQIGADWLNRPGATPEDYEWINADEMTAEEWIAAHPEVTAAAPAWANSLDADDEGVEGHVALSFDRLEGSVEIGSAATWYRGEVIQRDPGVYVYFKRNESRVTVADLRQMAQDFRAAADALAIAEVSK